MAGLNTTFMKNQRERIVDYINENGFITSFDAYAKLGITQLATRIKELKEIDGYQIETEWVYTEEQGKNYKRYRIEVNDEHR